jgi:hypothetical protein
MVVGDAEAAEQADKPGLIRATRKLSDPVPGKGQRKNWRQPRKPKRSALR